MCCVLYKEKRFYDREKNLYKKSTMHCMQGWKSQNFIMIGWDP